jgi:hypothetical protein
MQHLSSRFYYLDDSIVVSRVILDNRVLHRPLNRLADFTLSLFASLRAVRSGRANGLATLPQGGEGTAKN